MNFISYKNYQVIEKDHLVSDTKNDFNTAKQNELLFRIANSLLKIDDSGTIIQKAMDETKNAMNAFTVSIALYNKNEDKLVIELINRADGRNFAVYTKEFKMGEGVAGLAAKTRKVIMIPDIRTSTLFINKNKKNNFGGIIAVPMIIGGELIGVINISSEEPRIFTNKEAEFLTILSTIIAAAIKNNRLYKQLDNQVKNLSRLFGITSVTNLQAKNSINGIINSLPALLDSEKAHLLLYDGNETLQAYAASSVHADAFEKCKSISISSHTVSSTVFKTQKPILINNTEKSDLIDKRCKKILNIKKQVSVPVLANNKCIGVLHVINKLSGDFAKDDLKLASIVAIRIGAKIENSELITRINSESKLLDSIVQNANDGIAVFDEDKKILTWNKYLEKLSRVSRSSVIGKSFSVAAERMPIPRKDKERLEAKVESALSQRGIENGDFEITDDRGDNIWIRISYSSILDENDSVKRHILVIQDITKDKELLKAKNDFISTSTHELRTPLTVIKGYLSMLRKTKEGFDKSQSLYLSKAYEATERLSDLVEDLLSALRISDNKVEINLDNCKIDDLIELSIKNLDLKASNKKIAVDFFPQKRLTCLCDQEKTRKILGNLIENAIKYSRKYSKIKISVQQKDQLAKITIADEGIGIKNKDFTNIFEKFTRVSNPLSVKAGGTGLGLFIAKSLVEIQGGEIGLKSKLHHGSEFFFTLPLAK